MRMRLKPVLEADPRRQEQSAQRLGGSLSDWAPNDWAFFSVDRPDSSAAMEFRIRVQF